MACLKDWWQGLCDVEVASLGWVDWFNKKRLQNAIGYVSPCEFEALDFEAMYYDNLNPSGLAA